MELLKDTNVFEVSKIKEEDEMKKKEMMAKENKTEKTLSDAILELAKTAVEKGDVGTLEKLLDLRKQAQETIAKNEFYKALHGFQSELQPIKKSKVVYNKDGTIRYKYATFDDIVKTIQPLLKKYGLTFHFKPEYDKENQTIIVHCIITHVLGHQEVATFKAPLSLSDKMQFMQTYGSILTYAKRYSLSLALGLATEEDEDLLEEYQTHHKLLDRTPEKVLEKLPENLKEEIKTEVFKQIEEKTKEPKEFKDFREQREFREPKEISEQKEEINFEGFKDIKDINKMTEGQKRYILDLINRYDISMDEFIDFVYFVLKKQIRTVDELTKSEASQIIDRLKNWATLKVTERTLLENKEDIPF
jgi:hypothetical protein